MTFALWLTLGIIAVAALIASWLERRDENRRASRERHRLYKGSL